MIVTRPFHFLPHVLAAMLAVGCNYEFQGGDDEDDDSPEYVEPEAPRQVKIVSHQKNTIAITPKVTENSLTLLVSEVPEGAELECHLGQMPLVPCTNNAVFMLPPIGTHTITAVALKDDRIISLFESDSFEVVGNDQTGTSDDLNLLLIPKNDDFELHQTHLLTEPFVAEFDFETAPKCDVELKCAFGPSNTQFWGVCDVDGKSFTVTPEMLALGAQTVKVRAQCGDDIGPELHYPINAVPAAYEPLMLFEHKDSLGRHVFELVNQTDCTAEPERVKFECREPGSEYTSCVNSLQDPTVGTEIRIVCEDIVGPALTIE